MTLLVPLALFGWIPAVLIIFTAFRPRRAVIVSFLLGWMFLPPTGYSIPGFPDYTKVTAMSVAILLATMFFDPRSLTSLRPRWLDVPMLVWCLCPFASSMSNGLGAYDGMSVIVDQTFKWGLPYLLGRAYLKSLPDFRELAILLFIGGLIYVPFCLWEIRMSPNLNSDIYGFAGTGISYFGELGKWGSRPRVFMGNGLTLGMFMTAASLMGIWMWTTGSLKQLWGLPSGSLVLFLVAITVGCKNMGAISVLLFGLTALFATKWLRTPVLVYLLVLACPLYMAVRMTGKWSAKPMVDVAGLIHHKRAESLQFRLDNEDMLAKKALERPIFGWGRWGRNRVYDESTGRDLTVTDGLWIITLGTKGMVGLTALMSTMLLPALFAFRRFPVRHWVHPAVAPSIASAVLVTLYMIDSLFNAMLNPIYLVAAGGLVSLVTTQVTVRVGRQPRSARAISRASSARRMNAVPVDLANRQRYS